MGADDTAGRADRTLLWLSVAIFIGLIAAAGIFTPGSSRFLPPCPLYQLTGFYCPGCGSTRMLHHLLRGHWLTAFAQNPLAFVMLPFVVVLLFRQIRGLPALGSADNRRRWATGMLVVVVAFGVARNIPRRPFSYLAPGGLLQRR